MKSDLFFSIIIPTFNRGELISKTINSVLEQENVFFELIVVDDGSNDNTKEVINHFIEIDNRISYFYQENSERAVARNFGASKAKGKYLIFLDSDDCFSSKEHLFLLYLEIEKSDNKSSLFFTGATLNSTDGISLTRNIEKEELKSLDFFIFESVVPARVCIPKNFMEKFSFDTRCIVVEDTVLWTEIKNQFEAIYLPIFSVEYNMHDGNSVNIQKHNAYYKRLLGLKILYNQKEVGKKLSKLSKRKSLNRCYFGIADYYNYNNQKWSCKFWILKSLFLYPELDFKHKIKLLFDRKND